MNFVWLFWNRFSLKCRRGLTAMEFMIYAVIIVAFLALMVYISARMGFGGSSMIKYIRDFLKFGG